MAYFSHNGGEIFYEFDQVDEVNSRLKTPLVFIHGFSLDNRIWQPQRQALKDSQLLTYDLRGFGKSSLPAGEYSHHNDLLSLLDHLNIADAHLVGMSLGGEIAIDFALENPGRTRSITLLNSSLGGYKSTVDWNVHAAEVGIEQAKINWLNHPVFKSLSSHPDARKTIEQIVKDYSGWHWVNTDPRIKLDPPAKERLSELTMPITICVGENDLTYYSDIVELLKQKLPSARSVIIPQTGHLANLEEPVTVNELIKDQTNGQIITKTTA